MVAGCSNTSRTEYYQAVAATQAAASQEAAARYEALSRMATSNQGGAGDSAAVAAVMAIALSRSPTIQPQYIEDEAVTWGKILAGPIASLGAIWINSEQAKDLSKNNSRVAIARIEADAQTDQALYEALSQPPVVNLPAPDGNVTTDALGIVVDGMLQLGNSGLGATERTANRGFKTVEQIVGASYMTIENLAEDCGGCGACFTCVEPEPVVVTGGGEDCDGLIISPGYCVEL